MQTILEEVFIMRNVGLKVLCVVLFCSLSGVAMGQGRTDGPEGSEYKGFKDFDRGLSVYGEFGARIDTTGDDKQQGILFGLDLDYSTNDLFSVMLSYAFIYQDDPMHEILLSPYLTMMAYNVRLGLLVSPGFTIITGDNTKARFTLAPGAMATVSFAERFNVGLIARYHILLNANDFTSIAAMVGFSF